MCERQLAEKSLMLDQARSMFLESGMCARHNLLGLRSQLRTSSEIVSFHPLRRSSEAKKESAGV